MSPERKARKRLYDARWRKTHRSNVNGYIRRWRADNPEKNKELNRKSCRLWRERHPGQTGANSKKWRERHPAEVKWASQYYESTHREQRRAAHRRYYAANRQKIQERRRRPRYERREIDYERATEVQLLVNRRQFLPLDRPRIGSGAFDHHDAPWHELIASDCKTPLELLMEKEMV